MRLNKPGERIPLPYWGQHHLSYLFGTSNVMFGRYLNGLSYPTVQMIQKFEIVLGWPAGEQFALIPPHWEWPDQGVTRRRSGEKVRHPQAEPTDLRYAYRLRQVLMEWCDANPRTERLQDIHLHPALRHKKVPPGGWDTPS